MPVGTFCFSLQFLKRLWVLTDDFRYAHAFLLVCVIQWVSVTRHPSVVTLSLRHFVTQKDRPILR